jgi:hypothetical protein
MRGMKGYIEEEDIRDIDEAWPSGIRVVEEPRDLRGGKDSPEREAVEQILEQVKFVLQEVNSQEYVSTATKIGEQIQLEESIIQQDQQGQIKHVSKLQQRDQTHITSNL